jgi:signal transduction histidine kinase
MTPLEIERLLVRRILETSERERQMLSRELHDRIGQPLAALRINYDVMRRKLPPEALRDLSGLMERQGVLISEVIQLVRELTAELRPPELDEIGLSAALRDLAGRAGERYGLTVEVRGSGFASRLPVAAEAAFFRITQEAIANVAKHAGAKKVTIEVDEEDGEARVAIFDDGCGFDEAAKREGSFGMLTMRERAEEVGARLEVWSEPGSGTRVSAVLPRVTRTG